jgi:nucleotide-binding universal stress UspA family protein
LSGKLSAKLTLVRTVNLVALGMYGRGVPPDLLDILQNDAEQYLQRTAEALRAQVADVDTAFSLLHPADEIESLLREHPKALVVMTSHARSGLARTVLGSVADRIVRSAECPVLVVPPQRTGTE